MTREDFNQPLRFTETLRQLLNPKRYPLLWIALAALPFFLMDLGSPALNDGEGMYAEIAREMRLGDDWITPRLNGKRHFDKPPLIYWAAGIGQSLLGEKELAMRIWPALAAWATIPAVGAIGITLYTARAGWIGALVFATCVGPYIFGRMLMPDPLLYFWITLALLGYARGYMRSEKAARLWPWVMFASLGFASLSKGILGMGLPAAIIGLHVLLSGRLREFLSWKLLAGICLTAAIALPWPLAAAKANPDFLGYFVIREHILRFTGQRYPPDEFLPLSLFLILTWVWTFPWLALVPQALLRGFKRLRATTFKESEDLLLFLWIVIIIGLFSASRSRLEYYAMPTIPAFALLIGKLWDEVLGKDSQRLSTRGISIALGAMSVASVAAAIGALLVFGPGKDLVFETFRTGWPESGWTPGPEQIAVLDRIRIPSILTSSGVAVFVVGALAALRKSKPKICMTILTAMMIPIFFMVHWGFLVMEPFMSVRPIAEVVRETAKPADVVVFQEPHEYMWVGGIAFYTKRMVHIFKDPKFEGVESRRREPPERFLDRNGLLALWDSGKRVLVVADEHGPLAAMLSRERPVQVIANMGGRVVFLNGAGG
jgi:4-amino-4-deoxy-L-arabinose transferase-like glycosyltransferase